MSWESRTSGLPAATGLTWKLGDASVSIPASEDWTPGSLTVNSPHEWMVLTLQYSRPSGETRAEGYVDLRKVRIGGAP